MTLDEITTVAINPALALLPNQMDSPSARVMLLAIGLQESRFEFRRQLGNGPARGFWQFELGSEASRGGVWGVYLHQASRYWVDVLCTARGVLYQPLAIWRALEHDDVLAAGLARLLLFTDPHKLPALGDERGAWVMYAKRTWRPGKPHPDTWPGFHAQAVEFVTKE